MAWEDGVVKAIDKQTSEIYRLMARAEAAVAMLDAAIAIEPIEVKRGVYTAIRNYLTGEKDDLLGFDK